MTDSKTLDEARVRVMAAGLSADDVAMLDKLGWNDSAVAPVKSEEQAARYRRIEKALNEAVAPLSFAERGDSPEGKMAASFGAAVANWGDKGDDE
ncbi:MAG: hypothetical protein KGL46_01215 [Hyphomicrobiales bacterium]|nr:hypothetical protein [Hyphomicrobiales bacterium]